MKLLTLFLTLLTVSGARTDSPSPSEVQTERLRVFLDCPRGCDRTFIRQQIGFVDFVRDRRDAEVHLLISRERMGTGGWLYTLEFLLQEEGVQQSSRQLVYQDPQSSTRHERREGLVRLIAAGLVQYVAQRPVVQDLRIVYEPDSSDGPAAESALPEEDPWQLWVFRLRGNGSMSGEATSTDRTLYGSLSANRTTDRWKVRLSSSARLRDRRFTLSDGGKITSETRSYNGSALVVRALSDHLSAGALSSARSSTYLNQRFGGRASLALEYNYFPYMEATRRQLTVLYSVGASHFEYFEPTIYDRTKESVLDHNLIVSYDVQEPWGSANLALEGSNYLHDLDKHRLDFSSGTQVRILRGLALDASLAAALIRDQLYLPAGDASPEEVLLRRRQLRTTYRYSASMGFTYTFGSIFDSVVNPRFTGSSRNF